MGANANGRGRPTLLVVDDDADILLAARMLLRREHEVVTSETPEALPDLIARHRPDVILLDMNFARGATSGEEGLRWLDKIRELDPDAVVVVITAHGGVATAVDAMKHGATDFVSKPWDNERLLATVGSAVALRASRQVARVERQRAKVVAEPVGEAPILGNSPAMRQVMSLIERAAPTDANVLILGENGTGKELVARELHRRSRRADRILVPLDLGAVTESLFDSELFGHVKGAFTDARSDRIGRMQAADGGTLFLDEVGNLPLHLQPKLLTALEQRRVTPVGSNRSVPIDVRVISATNLSPEQLADEGRFRQDLLFRLNTIEITLPPLRQRREDVPLLLKHYLAFYARKYGREDKPVPANVMEVLTGYDWPGNVRALRHAAERAVVLSTGDVHALDDFPLPSSGRPQPVVVAPAGDDLNLDRVEKATVERALRKHGWNISLAAADLGLTRASLYRRMEKFGL